MDGRAKRPSYAELAAILVELRAEILHLKTRIVELEKKNPTPRLDESYTVKAVEKGRQQEEEQKSGKSRPHGSHGDQQASERRGRKSSQEKIDQANVHELVLPEGFNRSQKRLAGLRSGIRAFQCPRRRSRLSVLKKVLATTGRTEFRYRFTLNASNAFSCTFQYSCRFLQRVGYSKWIKPVSQL